MAVRYLFQTLVAISFGFAPATLQALTPAEEPAVQALQRVVPAVVNINTERTVSRSVRDPFDALYYDFFGGYAPPQREVRQRVQSLGSGFIIDPSGYIVTNAHVVERAADLRISVTLSDGTDLPAVYIAGNPAIDLALIKIVSDQPLPFISLDDLSPNLIGQTVLAVGNPLGYGSSVTRGILSARDRSVTVGRSEFQNLLQSDVAINPGNSGGPLVDINGKLVGVSSVKLAYTPEGIPAQGIGFAIPGDSVRDEVVRLRQQPAESAILLSRLERHFGIQVQDFTAELASAMGIPATGGALISTVEPRSPAALAGIGRGQVILRVGRYNVNTENAAQQIEELLAQIDTGSQVEFGIGVPAQRGRSVQMLLQSATLSAR